MGGTNKGKKKGVKSRRRRHPGTKKGKKKGTNKGKKKGVKSRRRRHPGKKKGTNKGKKKGKKSPFCKGSPRCRKRCKRIPRCRRGQCIKEVGGCCKLKCRPIKGGKKGK